MLAILHENLKIVRRDGENMQLQCHLFKYLCQVIFLNSDDKQDLGQ